MTQVGGRFHERLQSLNASLTQYFEKIGETSNIDFGR
jgi:hypothetical protein